MMKRKLSSNSKEDTNAHTTAYTQLCSAVLPGQVVHASPTSSARRVISVHSVIIVSCDYDGDSHDDDDDDDNDDDDDDDEMANLNLGISASIFTSDQVPRQSTQVNTIPTQYRPSWFP